MTDIKPRADHQETGCDICRERGKYRPALYSKAFPYGGGCAVIVPVCSWHGGWITRLEKRWEKAAVKRGTGQMRSPGVEARRREHY